MEKLPKNQAPAPTLAPRRRQAVKPGPTTPAKRLCNKAAAGLGKRAGGYVTCEVKSTYDIGPDGARTLKNQVVTRKQNPPDMEAIVFALTNLDGARWQAKPSPSADIPGERPFREVPDEVLRGLLNVLSSEGNAGGIRTMPDHEKPAYENMNHFRGDDK